jgi:hypothetical protein
MEIAMKDSF